MKNDTLYTVVIGKYFNFCNFRDNNYTETIHQSQIYPQLEFFYDHGIPTFPETLFRCIHPLRPFVQNRKKSKSNIYATELSKFMFDSVFCLPNVFCQCKNNFFHWKI